MFNTFGGMMDYGGFGGGWMLMGGLFMILFWAAIILLIIWLYNQIKGPEKITAEIDTAMNLLKKRYASGEIDKKEFAEMKKDLEK